MSRNVFRPQEIVNLTSKVSIDAPFDEEAEEFQVAEEADISPEEVEEEVLVMEEETDEGAAIELEADAEEGPALAEDEESIEELDFMGADDEEEGGLEFDLEDFMDDTDDDSDTSTDDEVAEIDIDLDDEDK